MGVPNSSWHYGRHVTWLGEHSTPIQRLTPNSYAHGITNRTPTATVDAPRHADSDELRTATTY